MLERNICPYCETKGTLSRNWSKEFIYAFLKTVEELKVSGYLTKTALEELKVREPVAEETLEEYDITEKHQEKIELFTCSNCDKYVTKSDLKEI